MAEEEQFVNIDLNDDNVCSICKLGTDIETLSFCHICFELSIEGIRRSDLLHTRSVRGHKDCFEKYHKIADQDCSRSKLAKSPYEEVKTIVSKKISWIVQYAQNKDLYTDTECSKPTPQKLYKFRQLNDRSLLPQHDSQVPRYSEKWLDAGARSLSSCRQGVLEQNNTLQNPRTAFCHGPLWPSTSQSHSSENCALEFGTTAQRYQHYSKEQLNLMGTEELGRLKEHFLRQIKDVFEELSSVVQEKDTLSSELNGRHIAIEQLLKNCSKLPCLQMGRAGMKVNMTINN
ncbi:PREDICTED: protein EURL homolog [Nanorana parkeri]|uniref:protein EURL homolog n=1 Tax=Nanorana parkeri TaxID=125878 RepID=UPI0008543481|nr:PREDICTED: protein EURL homolog [Nanorana parkeri]